MEVLDPVVRMIQEAGIPCESMVDRDSLSLMHRAVVLGEVDRLGDFREEVNAVDNFGLSPLHYAVLLSVPWQTNAARDLIVLGADFSIASNNGKFTPLHLAAQRGNWELVELFLKEGGETLDCLDLCSTKDGSALCLACKSQSLATVEALVKAGADVNVCDEEGMTPLHIVAQDILSVGEKTPLVVQFIRTLGQGKSKIFDGVLNINATDQQGHSPLHLAARVGNLAAIDYLLHLKADVKSCDLRGRTPLHYASCGVVIVKDFAFVKSLIAAGANLGARDKRGLSASDCITAVLNSRTLSRNETTALSVARSYIEKELKGREQLIIEQAQADANAAALLAEESTSTKSRKKK